MKNAYYADHIYFNSQLFRSSWLLTNGDIIEGCAHHKPEGYNCHVFENSAIFPSFINTHTHAPMSLLRGYADDLPLHTWLNEHIWPAEKRLLSYEFVKDASMLAAAEFIRGGTSCISDMYFFPEVEIEAFTEAGIRSLIGTTVMGAKSEDKLAARVEPLLAKAENNLLTKIAIAPHAVYTASADVYRIAVDICHKHDLLLHTHLSETQQEIDNAIKEHGKSPVQIMNDVGAFDCKSIFAHCVHLSEADIALMGQKKANVSHCLQSNLKLTSGFAPVIALMQAGANVSIGTDGASSNNDQDMLSELQSVALVHKALSGDPTAINAETALKMATENAAKAINWNNIGSLKIGNQADFMVVSYESVHMQPLFSPLSNLIYSGQQRDITDVFVAGRQLMKNRELTTIDEKELIAKAKRWVEKIA